MCECVQEFVDLHMGGESMALALVVPGGIEMTTVAVSNIEGTFLARSTNPRARVVAALTALHEMSLEHGYAAW